VDLLKKEEERSKIK